MSQYHYDFFDDLLVEVNGVDGRTARQYRKMFDHFRVRDPARDPDLVITETTSDVVSETVLGDPADHYGWTGERFVIANRGGYLSTRPGWQDIEVSPGFEPFYSIYPMEFQIRREMVERNKALIHASGVRLDGQTTLFPAWRGAGKTNTLLSLLQQGADFLSDDRLWVGADGSAVGYPLGVNLQPYNVESFPEIGPNGETFSDRFRHRVHRLVDERTDKTGSLPETALAYLNEIYLGDDDREFIDIESLYPDATYVEESTVDNVVFLEAAPNASTVTVERLTTEEAMSAATAISNFEWDGRLREYFHAYDALARGDTIVERLEDVIQRERSVFRDLFETVPTYRASIPRKRNWRACGLDSAVVDVVESLERRTESAVTK